MPAEVLYKGPKPLPGERWCFACAVWIDATGTEDLPPLATAVGVGLFGPMTHLGVLELCWSHLTAIRLQSTGGLHLPAPGQGVPGMNGMGGLLG